MIDSYSKIDFLKTKLKQDKKRESRVTFLYGKRKITFALDVRMEDFLRNVQAIAEWCNIGTLYVISPC